MRTGTQPRVSKNRFAGLGGRSAIRYVAALVSVLALPDAALAQHPLMLLPLGDPAYTQLAALERMGCASARVSPHRPYTIGAIRRALGETRSDPMCLGPIEDALLARFVPVAPTSVRALDTTGVASDLAAAAAAAAEAGERAPRVRIDTTERLRIGALATIRAVSLSKDEFHPLWLNVRADSAGQPIAVGILRARVSYAAGPRFLAVSEAYGQTSARNDPLVRGRLFRRTTGVLDFSEAYLTGRAGPLTLSFGRAREAWLGEGEESLVLSAHGPALDRLLATLRTRRVEARAFVAMLNDVVLDTINFELPSGTPSQRFHRVLVGHVLTYAPTKRFEFSLGETALLSRGSRMIDLAYANPLTMYLVTQNDRGRAGTDRRDNLTLFGSARARLGPATLSGELLVDDFQLDSRDRELTPHQLGFSFRGSIPMPTALPMSVSAEFRRLDGFTYLRGFYSDVYQQYDAPLGSEIGPDATLLRGEAELWLNALLRINAGAGLWERGAQRLTERPSQSAIGRANLPFPTRTDFRPEVQRAFLFEGGAQLLSGTFPVTFRVEGARIQRPNNQVAATAFHVRTVLVASYAFRYP